MKFSILKKKRFYVILIVSLLLLLYLFMNFVISFSSSNEVTLSKYKEAGVPLKIKNADLNGISYQWMEIANDSSATKPIVLFVHGSPGASEMFGRFLMNKELIDRAILISVDRLGYGHSNFGVSEPSLEKQAEQLHHLISQYKGHKVIAIGHSYGGPIIARQAIDYPEDLDALLLLAPALDPDNEKFKVLARLSWWKLTKWYFPKLFRVSSDEKMAHVEELNKLKPLLGQINIPTVHVHGKKDWIVPYENLNFSRKLFNDSILTIVSHEEADHLLFTKEQAPIVIKEIHKLLDQIVD